MVDSGLSAPVQHVVVYATIDLPLVRQVDHRIRIANPDLQLWIDVDQFRGDTNWGALFRSALDISRSVVFVVSDLWDYDDDLTTDLQTAIAAVEAFAHPLTAVYLDVGAQTIPETLSSLPWRRARLDGDPAMSGLDGAFSTAEVRLEPTDLLHWHEFINSYDPRTGQLRRTLRHRLDEIFDNFEDGRYEVVEAEWAAFLGFPYFAVSHETWTARPGLRSRLHLAKSLFFMSEVQLSARADWTKRAPLAFEILGDVASIDPFVCAPDGLSVKEAATANANYRDCLDFATSWLEPLPLGIFKNLGISELAERALRRRITDRREELTSA